MELEMIASLLEDALQSSLENGMRAVREGDTEAGLQSLERGYAKVASALDSLRSFHGAGTTRGGLT
jgi:hypothetical protein